MAERIEEPRAVPPRKLIRLSGAVLCAVCCVAAWARPADSPAPSSYYDARDRGAAPRAASTPRTLATPKDETLTRLIRLRSRLRDLDMKWVTVDGDEVMEAFTARLGGGSISAECRINWTRPEQEHRAVITLRDVGASEFLQAADVRIGARIDAPVNGRMELRWRGLKVRQMRETLAGTATLEVGKGSISNTRILDAFAEYSGIRALRRFEFDSGVVKATCTDGRVQVDPLDLRGPLMRAVARGHTDLETDAMSLRFDLWVLADAAGQSVKPEVRAGVSWLREMAGRTAPDDFMKVPLPFSFGGTLSRPAVLLDFDLGEKP